MAEHTKTHLWLNTLIACLALAASSASTILTWRSYQLKAESLGFGFAVTADCELQYRKVPPNGLLGLCWLLLISNQSDTRTSIVALQTFNVLVGASISYNGFTQIENAQGGPLAFPINLDDGEARSYLVRVPIVISDSVAQIIDNTLQSTPLHKLRLRDLRDVLVKSDLDLIGNPIKTERYDSGSITTWTPNLRRAVGQIKFRTGRGNYFVAQVAYPPDLFQFNP